MNEYYSTDTARIRALKSSMLSLLESAHEETVAASRLRQGADLLAEAFQEILNAGSQQLVSDSVVSFGKTLHLIEEGYDDWRTVDSAFARTLSMAYCGYIPRENLKLDVVRDELRARVGEPISALHAKLHAAWQDHINNQPWDEYLADDAADIDTEHLDANLKLLSHGDHMDVEDAAQELTGPLRYSFANYLKTGTESVELLEEGLWIRPEIVVMNDYWNQNSEVRLLDVLSKNRRTKRAECFAQVRNLLAGGSPDDHGPQHVVEEVQKTRLDERDAYYRCLMLHPDYEIRRYAVSNIQAEGFWKVATPHTVPCGTILTMLERVAGSKHYDENFQKIFFQTVHKRLSNLTSRSEVLYARGIVRIFARLRFVMEDEYFEKFTNLIDYISIKEKTYDLKHGVLEDFTDLIRREKDRVGTLKAQPPNLTSIPAVVLRKLARDGHYWYELAMHPMFKIARETIPHINSADRALRIAKNHVINPDILREVGKKRSLFNTYPAKIALLSNPRTPPMVSIAYLMDISKNDAAHLLRRSTVHPELRLHLRNRLTG